MGGKEEKTLTRLCKLMSMVGERWFWQIEGNRGGSV